MNTIEQAKEVSSRLRAITATSINRNTLLIASHTIDALIAELEKIKSQDPIATLYVDNYGAMGVSQISPPENNAFLVYLAPGAQPVPEGMQLVPIEPTKAMLNAPPNAWSADARITYKAMLEAAKE